MKDRKWLKWAQRLQSIAQIGLEYSNDVYDIERFEQIRELCVEIMSEYTDIENCKVRDLFANETGYQTPKVDIRAAVFRENRMLLVNETMDGKWSMPGGWADIGHSVYENIKKECLEEAGAIVKPINLIALLDRSKHHEDIFPYWVYKVFIECEYIEGEYIDNIETSEARFFAEDELPELSITRNTEKQIKMCFDARVNGSYTAKID